MSRYTMTLIWVACVLAFMDAVLFITKFPDVLAGDATAISAEAQ